MYCYLERYMELPHQTWNIIYVLMASLIIDIVAESGSQSSEFNLRLVLPN
jgi:hypothetical protein